MFQRIRQYDRIEAFGRWYEPRVYGDQQPDSTWDGWLIFFQLGGRSAIAPSSPETTQRTRAALELWAAGLTPIYLEGALTRAIELAQQPPVLNRLTDAEYEALAEAERLERAAEAARTSANLDKAAAETARADAKAIREERFAAESTLADAEAEAATIEANIYDDAASDARAVASTAKHRADSAAAKATPRKAKATPRKRKAATKT